MITIGAFITMVVLIARWLVQVVAHRVRAGHWAAKPDHECGGRP